MFEASRENARRAFDKLVHELKDHGSNERLLEKLISLRSGDQSKDVAVAALFAEWSAIPRAASVSSRHEQNVKAMFTRFARFVSQAAPSVQFVSMVTPRIAERFMDGETKRGVSAKTFNEILGVMRKVFEHLGTDAMIAKNPFRRIQRRRTETVSRLALLPVLNDSESRCIPVASLPGDPGTRHEPTT